MQDGIRMTPSPRARSIARILPLCVVLAVLLFSGSGRAEDGYRLWLRYDRIEDARQRAQYSRLANHGVVPGDSATADVIRQELKTALSGLIGEPATVSDEVTRDGAVVIATSKTSVVRELNLNRELEVLGDDGFLVRSVVVKGRAVTLVASRHERGALYGTFHLLRLMQTGADIARLDVSERPRLKRRLLNHWDNLNGTVERGYAGRSLWDWSTLPDVSDPRYRDYARANASIGINGAVLNNVNARPEQLREDYLRKAAALADVFRPYGIRVYLTAHFAAPQILGGLSNANPNNPAVRRWWKDKANEIYRVIPDFGGFLVKANSEGQPGPQDYGLTHADGANLLAEALEPHGGIVMWRAFVYNSPRVDKDRANRAYLEFKPFDGQFRRNVLVQPKTGPIDFQPREPFHPLFGALPRTSLMAELQITQENMGHSRHLVYLAPMWKEVLESDTHARGQGTTVAKILEACEDTGVAGVANTGRDPNWCGHDFAQANWYAFGRLAWDHALDADQIAEEWIRMTWSNDAKVVATLARMMRGSWEACVNYEMPLGLHHIMEAGGHYDPRPETVNRRSPEYSAWYYHQASAQGIGFDRTRAGSNAVGQYAPAVRDWFADPATCPSDLLLWFHHVEWDQRLRTGRTVWEELCFRYNDGVDYVKEMQADWETMRGRVDGDRFGAVEARLAAQVAHATRWRDVCVRYFQSVNNKPLPAYLAPADTVSKN
jgi:alpha-glucuronidase